jgi:hypothetical protein
MAEAFKIGAGFVDFATDIKLLNAIQKLSKAWSDMDQINDGRSLIDALNDAAQIVRSDAVRQAFGPALAGEYTLVLANADRFLGKLDAFGKRPAARLLDRLDRFQDPDRENLADDPGVVNWTPLNVDGGIGAVDTAYLSLAASANIAFEAGDRWPYIADSEADPSLNRLLRISATGSGQVDGGVKAAFPMFGLKVDAAASSNAGLSYYFLPRATDQLFGLAVASSLANLPNPFAFAEMWKKFQTSDLKAIDLYFDGGVSFGGKVGLAFTTPIQGSGGLSAGVSVRAKVTRASKLQLSLRATAPAGSSVRPVAMTLSRDTATASELGVNVDVELDPADFALKVASVMNRVLDAFDERIEKLRPYLNPGLWLQTQASDALHSAVRGLLNNDALEEELIADMRSALGRGVPSARIVSWAEETLAGAIEAQADKVLAGGVLAVDAVTALLKEKLLPNAFSAQVAEGEAEIREAITSLIARHSDALKDTVGDLSATLAGKLKGLLEKTAGTTIAAITDIDSALAGVRKALAQIDATTAKTRKGVEAATKAKLHGSFFAETKRYRESEFLLAGTFNSGGEAAERLYKAMLGGSEGALAVAFALFEDSGAPGAFQLDEDRSWLVKRSGWETRRGGALVLLDFKIVGSRLLKADADIRITASNDVEVNAEAEIRKEQERLDGRQLFTLTTPLVRSGRMSAGELALNLNLDRFEKDLLQNELVDYLDNLERAGLLRPESIARALNELQARGMVRGGNRRLPAAASVRLDLAIDGMAAQSLLRLRQQPTGILSDREWKAILRTALRWLDVTGAWPEQEQANAQREAASWLKREADEADRAALFLDFLFAQGSNFTRISTEYGEWVKKDDKGSDLAKLFLILGAPGEMTRGGRIRKLAEAISTLREAVLAAPVGFGPGQSSGWTEKDYEAAFQTIAENFKEWLPLRARIFKLADDLRPTVIAFTGILIELAGLDSAAAVSLTLRFEDTDETILIA